MLSKETPSALARSRSMSMLQLRRVLQAVGTHAGEHLALRRHAEHLVARGDSAAWPLPPRSCRRKAKPVARAELGDRRRHEREDERVAHARQRAEGAAGEGLRRVLGALALVPRLERDEGERRVLALAREAEAEHADHLVDLGLVQEEALGLLHHGERARLRRARRQLHVGDQVALVLVRQERRRHAREHEDDERRRSAP